MADLTLLFGIGATKAGTSWLHRWLSQHPEVHLWEHKEIHYFDTLDEARVMQQIDAICERRAVLRQRMKRVSDPERQAHLAGRVAEYDRYLGLIGQGRLDPAAYMQFLAEGRGAARVVGDITPSYALLSEDRLRFMAALGPVTRFLYLLRDPVERLWSNIRTMAARRGGVRGGLRQTAARLLDRWVTRGAATRADERRETRLAAFHIFDRWAAGQEPALDQRSDYAGTLRRLFAAVPEAGRMVLFHEELFAEPATRSICGFLGIAPLAAPHDVPANVGPRLTLDTARRAVAADRLARQYDEVKSLLGRVPQSWQPMGVQV